MSKRGPNKNQAWPCPIHGNRAVNTLGKTNISNEPPVKSFWGALRGYRGYRRTHRCMECGNTVPTFELETEKIEKLVDELNLLRTFRDEISKALKAAGRIELETGMEL